MFFLKAHILSAAAIMVPLAIFGQTGLQTAPVPSDPLELATGSIQVVGTPEDRAAVLNLLSHARGNYLLKTTGAGYDIKVSFIANSGGVTQYDGAWQMEEMFVPGIGFRWTATTENYSTTQIRADDLSYGDAAGISYPLVLHEARGVLFGPMPALSNARHDLIRTTTATLNGTQLTCVLLSGPGNFSRAGSATMPAAGRSWEETEECIDPQSGLLVTHSLVPGRYALYDYSNGLQFHGHIFPRKVTITEAGNPVVEVHVDSLEDFSSPDPALFAPTEQMKARGPATEMAAAYKVPAFPHGPEQTNRGSVLQPVIVFGLLVPSGEILEAHSLQPSSPDSQAAVESVKSMNWHVPTAPGAAPEERFVFVFERFPFSPR
jgi:hypothetical protein